MAKLSAADKVLADFIASETKAYGPLSKDQISDLARRRPSFTSAIATPGMREKSKDMLSYALANLANEMHPDEKVTGAVPWWKRL